MKRGLKHWLLTAMLLGTLVTQAREAGIEIPAGTFTIQEIMKHIEKQTSYKVAYNNRLLDTARLLDFEGGNVELLALLERITDNTALTFIFHEGFIIISPVLKNKSLLPDFPQRARYEIIEADETYTQSPIENISAAPLLRPWRETASKEPETSPEETESRPELVYTSYYVPVDIYRDGTFNRLSLKTNLLYGAIALAPNISLEVSLNSKWTLESSFSYNGWGREADYNDNKKLVHFVARQEARYWLCEPMNGHFFGANAGYMQFNVSTHDLSIVDFKKEYRYQGNAWGAGITYGYHLPVGRNWGVEFNAGIGFWQMNYSQFTCNACSEVQRKNRRTYFGPTRAGISLVYIIK